MNLTSIVRPATAAAIMVMAVVAIPEALAQESTTIESGPVQAVTGSAQRITMTMGKGQLFKTSVPFTKVSVTDDKIVDVTPQSNGEFVFTPKGVGSTNVLVFDEKNALIATLDINVVGTAIPAKSALRWAERPRSTMLPGVDKAAPRRADRRSPIRRTTIATRWAARSPAWPQVWMQLRAEKPRLRVLDRLERQRVLKGAHRRMAERRRRTAQHREAQQPAQDTTRRRAKPKKMKGNERKIAFISFHLFFQIGAFQRVTLEKIKKIAGSLNSPLRLHATPPGPRPRRSEPYR